MAYIMFDDNQVVITGKIAMDFTFSHKICGECFYKAELQVKRLSDSVDTIPVLISEQICKPTVYRKTPLKKEITDLLLAVNRSFGKSDYIPCICWGSTARYAADLKVGTRVMVWGRIQSREYKKRIEENETQKRIVYEVSINTLEVA